MAGEWKTVLLSDLYEFSSGISKPRSVRIFGTPLLICTETKNNRPFYAGLPSVRNWSSG